MSLSASIHSERSGRTRNSRALANVLTACIAGLASFGIIVNAAFVEVFHATRLGALLAFLFLIHATAYGRIRLTRETVLYLIFVLYMLLQLLWTDNITLARNTLIPAFNFVLIVILFGSFVLYYDRKSALFGMIVGSLVGLGLFTATSGFPFTYPADFSYNAIALAYLFVLFLALLCGTTAKWRSLTYLLAPVILAHIVATTSIKTNLGLFLGASIAALVCMRHTLRVVRRHLLILSVLVFAALYVVASNDALLASMERGVDRISLGIEILQAREDRPGYTGFSRRSQWQSVGLNGWRENPVFGHGVEAFRFDFGITSHSTPLDLLYNSGLIGFLLFYAILASVAFRCFARTGNSDMYQFLILSMLICFSLITVAGMMHYNAFLAAFIGLSVALLQDQGTRPAVAKPVKKDGK